MSSFISAILKLTVGVICNKIRDKTAENLKDGDVTDAKLREFVVGKLNDIKTKLEALSRKNLLSSYDFLDQGIRLLLDCIENSQQLKEGEQEKLRNLTQGNQVDSSLISSNQSSERSKDFDQEHKLDEAFKTLSIESPGQLKTAVEKFKKAGERATDAFNNESLSIEDRIFASKIRVVSTILECMECPETAITLCLSFLEKLHSLPAICEIFDVYINGGVKSLLNKKDRVENVRSVMFINRLLYQFIMKFGKTYHMALYWPTIQLKDKQFNPILNWREISERNSWDSEVQGANQLEFKRGFDIRNLHCNSSNDLIYCEPERNLIKIMRKGADDEIAYEFPEGDVIKASFMDKNDDMYIIVQRETSSDFHIVVFASHFLVKSEISLDLTYKDSGNFPLFVSEENIVDLEVNIFSRLCLFVSAENIVVFDAYGCCVFVYDLQGKLIKQFTVEQIEYPRQRIVVTNENEIVLCGRASLYIYSMDGYFKSKVNLYLSMVDFFYYFGLKKFVIIEGRERYNYRFHSCDLSGKLETLTDLKDIDIEGFLSSNPVPVVYCYSARKYSARILSRYLMWC
ncbi:uncharacterized protein LOC124451890 isoform X1 [Xenia sp. Carnegie-2017]|uniref:uncharacterized protein LOC124451890 isoform X1 n=1 Tax=Xenia sp. Carnegie-2017 TaxID=2897299 RepID=UPI001F03D899|nr:uncharacterized protein LOC124451890 isoform X1 [Xenia sp. Carnegie-2017]XP_046858439.1 uncharacterized protein LOC124451890 isoform X1 [Xenia sp. Carnegie-2017]XP_046858440.1 uncharacterized protein LOC124451890 isoform X1 [Xenia sp. Carnegie-2017]XP_046858441.1 uncharacterized protein LOC124451890 isoform X1 [Xenia sp. Carnegie-2017]XP_046858442.1 uncharacterized protein LOC124451890 isoform X1 [Xenia sp. Carnegie-2017]XP_046858443.1 uncharacterized protein LOC124451890 isoform X1 [Xenia 